jgi:hypothetical protein
VTGKVLENFAATEVLKHAEWATTDTTAYHYRQREEEIGERAVDEALVTGYLRSDPGLSIGTVISLMPARSPRQRILKRVRVVLSPVCG